jgi:hypothetical protein
MPARIPNLRREQMTVLDAQLAVDTRHRRVRTPEEQMEYLRQHPAFRRSWMRQRRAEKAA